MSGNHCRYCGELIAYDEDAGWVDESNIDTCGTNRLDGLHFPELPVAASEPVIPVLLDFVPEPGPDTRWWRHTYAHKPAWWDDPAEPRCDYCGIHCDDGNIDARGGWCGDCGQCRDHCEC